MEKDDEINGSGNAYGTQFRSLDPRLGRWFSMDPVIHDHQSPYNAFDSNPVNIMDPTGADGEGNKETGQITATIYIKFDTDAFTGLEGQELQDAKDNYLTAVKTSITNAWNGQTLDNGVNVSADNVQVIEASADMTVSRLKKNENLITVGNGASAPEDAMPNVSHVEGGGRNNSGYFYLSNGGSEAGHEFGHMLGLTDRYFNGVISNVTSFNNSTASVGRFTIPVAGIKEDDYDYQNNLMSGPGTPNLTEKQLNIAFNRNRNEKKHAKFAVIHSQTVIQGVGYDGLSKSGKYYRNGTATQSAPLATYRRSTNNSSVNSISPVFLRTAITTFISNNNITP